MFSGTLTTTPAPSIPSPIGHAGLPLIDEHNHGSTAFNALACTLTKTSSRPGRGVSTDATVSFPVEKKRRARCFSGTTFVELGSEWEGGLDIAGTEVWTGIGQLAGVLKSVRIGEGRTSFHPLYLSSSSLFSNPHSA